MSNGTFPVPENRGRNHRRACSTPVKIRTLPFARRNSRPDTPISNLAQRRYGEIEFAAIHNRSLTAATATVPQNYASLYLTLGLRLKLFPGSRLSPWGAIGDGYALYEASAQLSNGQNITNKFLNRAVFDYGGGLDYRLFRFVGLRRQVRDFFPGNPDLNAALHSGTQDKAVASGGITLRF